MDNDNLLKRCETLEADFNALGDYSEKRDFVDRFLKDVEPLYKTIVFDWYYKEFGSHHIENYNTAHEQFLKKSKDAPAIKIRQNASNKAKELLQNEFKKIKKDVIIEIAVLIFIHECDSQNQNLKEISNLLNCTSQIAISKFKNLIGKSDYSFKYIIIDVIEKYNANNYIVLDWDSVLYSIENGKLFTDDNIFIFGSDLAPKIIAEIDKIYKPTPPTNPETPTDDIKKVLEIVSKLNESRPQTNPNSEIKAELKEARPQRIIINEAIPPPTPETSKGRKETDNEDNSKNTTKQATEYDLLKELKTIKLVLIWLKVTFDNDDKGKPKDLSRLDSAIDTYKNTGKKLKGQKIKNLLLGKDLSSNKNYFGHFGYDIDTKNGTLISSINYIIKEPKDIKSKKPNHRYNPFTEKLVLEFIDLAKAANLNQLVRKATNLLPSK